MTVLRESDSLEVEWQPCDQALTHGWWQSVLHCQVYTLSCVTFIYRALHAGIERERFTATQQSLVTDVRMNCWEHQIQLGKSTFKTSYSRLQNTDSFVHSSLLQFTQIYKWTSHLMAVIAALLNASYFPSSEVVSGIRWPVNMSGVLWLLKCHVST